MYINQMEIEDMWIRYCSLLPCFEPKQFEGQFEGQSNVVPWCKGVVLRVLHDVRPVPPCNVHVQPTNARHQRSETHPPSTALWSPHPLFSFFCSGYKHRRMGSVWRAMRMEGYQPCVWTLTSLIGLDRCAHHCVYAGERGLYKRE